MFVVHTHTQDKLADIAASAHSVFCPERNKPPLFSSSGWSSMEKRLTGQHSRATFTTSHSNSCEIVESQIAGMAFFSTGSNSFLCTPRPGMLGNQCTALIKALTSCLYRKQSLTRSLLISCRSQSVCEIVLPIKTCLSMKTSAGMWPYQYVICCLRASGEIESLSDECSVKQ